MTKRSRKEAPDAAGAKRVCYPSPVTIDPHGDLKLIVGAENEKGVTVEFKVDKATLRRASPVWDAKLSEIPFPEDDAFAFDIVLLYLSSEMDKTIRNPLVGSTQSLSDPVRQIWLERPCLFTCPDAELDTASQK